ncbi:MAG: class I SAM-dependent methyltransferase [Sporichthyaceae bacterium]|nr:class I SAM-dependent methyltransferase [Sporichthyaceae bacterium]
MADRARSLSFERIADRYDVTRGGEERGAAFAAGIEPWLPDGGPILEVGVGTGAVAATLHRNGHDIVGVDLSPAMLARAVDRIGPRVAVADAHRLPIASGSMAAAYLVWVLHVVADPGAVLAEVTRVLRPGGVFVAILARPTEVSVDVDRLLRAMAERLRGSPVDEPDGVIALGRAAGLEPIGRAEVASKPYELVPTEVAARIYDRTYSALWDVDEQTWQAEVEPVVAALRELPDPHRARINTDPYPLLAFRRT